MSSRIQTDRLTLRPWTAGDVSAALSLYGVPEVARELTPTPPSVRSAREMRAVIDRWRRDPDLALSGHWAAETREVGSIVGGLSLQPLGPEDDDLTITCALHPAAWGNGYATEAASALLRWALHEAGATEVFALVRSDNARALATTQRIGMEWVEDHDQPGGAAHQVFRLRHGDLGLAD